MPRRERKYRVVLDVQPPADLAARCSAVWRELLDIAEHRLGQQRRASEDRNRLAQDHRAGGADQDCEPVMAE